MKRLPSVSPLGGCHLSHCSGCPAAPSRRAFLSTAGLAAAGVLAAPRLIASAGAKTRIRIVYALHGETQEVPDWPNKGFDFRPVMARINEAVARGCPDCEFLPTLATGEEQAKKIVEADAAAGIDGYLVYQMNCWNRVVQTMAATGKPVLYADFQFAGSGGFLVYTAALLRAQAPNVGFVASSRLEDLVEAVKCFPRAAQGGSAAFVAAVTRARVATTPSSGQLWREASASRVSRGASASRDKPDSLTTLPIADCVRHLKESKILAVRGKAEGLPRDTMGIQVAHVPFAEVNDAWKAADREESRAVAGRWQKAAARVEGVSFETLETSAAMYLGMKSLLKKHGAVAITMDCLGGFYGGHIHAYPCLGFHELNNEALVGACECDVRSTATMVAGTLLTRGRPGYISDPVIDTSKRQIIYAHCVASNRPFGPRGPSNPFEILTHSEDRQGASVRSVLPAGYMTTTLEFEASRKEVLFHQARAVGNDPDDRACRTKLCAEPVGDLEKLFTMWDQWGWHRVTFYGDLKEPVYALADALGYKVVEEA